MPKPDYGANAPVHLNYPRKLRIIPDLFLVIKMEFYLMTNFITTEDKKQEIFHKIEQFLTGTFPLKTSNNIISHLRIYRIPLILLNGRFVKNFLILYSRMIDF